MKTLTVYRPTNAFFDAMKVSTDLLNLHRERTCSFGKAGEADGTLVAINTMLANDHLVPVATVTCETLDDAYMLTNSITRNWTENDEVTVLDGHDGFLSSSSVGDIFKDSDGTFQLVESFGFATLVKQADGTLARA